MVKDNDDRSSSLQALNLWRELCLIHSHVTVRWYVAFVFSLDVISIRKNISGLNDGSN